MANQATPEDTSDELMKMAADASTTPLLKPISSGSNRYAHSLPIYYSHGFTTEFKGENSIEKP